jgi:Skp family chaperone for outer membrane proteins
MRKVLFALPLLAAVTAGAADNPTIEALRSSAFAMPRAEVAVPGVPAPVNVQQPAQVPQDLLYKFQQFRNELSRIDNDTTWLRNDINRLESEARRIEQGSSAAFFASDLRRMKYDMDRRKNDLQRLAYDIKDLLSRAVKDDGLNRLARDIEWDARDLDNRFQFDVLNAAQSLESTVRRIDPKVIGYDAQWNASDLTRACRDIQWKTRDMRWDAQDLVRRTQP